MRLSFARFGTLTLVATLVACATPPIVETARGGDRAALAREIERARAEGELNEERVLSIARAVLEGEIARSRDPSGPEFVRSLASCAGALDEALGERSEKKDETGSEAAVLLAERDAFRGPSASSLRDAPEGGLRAVAALHADGADDHELRARYLLDPDPRVRRAVIRAIERALDVRDLPPLLEASRVDPDPIVKNRALTALGAFGGADVTNRLLDRFRGADEAERLAIVDAFASDATYALGGQDALERIAADASLGLVAVHAASTLGAKGAPDEIAFGRLATFVKDGTTDERRLAVRLLPIDHAKTRQVLDRAGEDPDHQVALVAWVRLYARASSSGGADDALRKKAETRLLGWARSKAPGDLPLSHQARAALAAYGRADVLPHLKKDARAEDPDARVVAGTGLIRLGAFASVAPLLADPDENVRRAVACRLLTPHSE